MNLYKISRRRASGPFTPTSAPVTDAQYALEAGVSPSVVASMFLPMAIRHRCVGALFRTFERFGAGDSLVAALTSYGEWAA